MTNALFVIKRHRYLISILNIVKNEKQEKYNTVGTVLKIQHCRPYQAALLIQVDLKQNKHNSKEGKGGSMS
jgi:hypothetical protein